VPRYPERTTQGSAPSSSSMGLVKVALSDEYVGDELAGISVLEDCVGDQVDHCPCTQPKELAKIVKVEKLYILSCFAIS